MNKLADPNKSALEDVSKAPHEESARTKAHPRLLRSGMVVSAMTFISRVLGLIRDIVIAALMGAGQAADVFFFANKIPNFLRRLFAEGAFAQAFVPVLTEYHRGKSLDDTRLLIARVAGTLGTIITVVTLLAVIGSVASQVGDLTASLLKRYSGIKDYGKLFPGHGGVMDRFDSVIFALIVMYCYTLVLH